MGSGISLDDAAIMSTVLEGTLYGFSLLMFIGTIWVLTHEEVHHAPNWGSISIAVVLVVLSTTHMVLSIVRIDEGLVKYRNTFPGGPLAFFEDIAQYTFVIKAVVYILQTLLGDGVVIYRCYVVWQSIWIIILPSMLWCSVAMTGIALVYGVSQATVQVNAPNIISKEISRWVTAFYASTLTTNLLSSGLLAYRIWTIERNVASMRSSEKSTLMPVLRVLVDAALLYSITLFIALLFFVKQDNGQFVVPDLIMPIITIAFCMVLIRIAMRRKSKNLRYATTTRCASRTVAVESQETAYRMRPLEVHISQFSTNNSTPPYQLGNQELERDHQSLKHEGEIDGATYKV